MDGLWLVSYIALWILVSLLCLLVFVLARQISLLHSRVAPNGARMTNSGPAVGEKGAELTVEDVKGEPLTIGGKSSLPRLLIFLTPTCEACSALAPQIRTLWRHERQRLQIVLAILYSSNIEQADAFLVRNGLDGLPATLSPVVGLDYHVISPPYAILLDETGTVRAKGIANNLEHLESIVNSLHEGYSSMEEWFANTRSKKAFDAREVEASS